ncbi:hypothetical protein [Streptosporangium roseum]|uniref:hypothetical protein n=1 Tax=Streptosporangium roseum TaxID=2001 RepID=UPI0004CD4215|nr:hypothetical protein [Streptosporangium roseum]
MSRSRRGTSQALRQAERAARKMENRQSDALAHLMAPWLVMGGTFVSAATLRLAFDVWGVTGWAGLLLGISTAALGALSWKLTHQRGPIGRWHDVVNTVAPMSTITLTTWLGFHTQILLPALIVGITTCLAWNKRHTRHGGGELAAAGAGAGGAREAEWQAFTDEHLPQLKGSQLTVLRDDSEQMVAGLKLGPSQVPEDVGHVLNRIGRWAGGIRAGANMIVGDSEERVLLTLMRRDPLAKPFDWAGPNAPGANIIEPIAGLGVYRNGADLQLTLPHTVINGAPKVVFHLLSTGLAGAGKTESGWEMDASIITRRESALIFGDGVKADQSIGPIEDGAAYILRTVPMIKALLKRLVEHTIPARAAYLGDPTRNLLSRPLSNWVPGCGLTFLTVHLAEGGALFGVQAMTTLAERCRSVGIHLHLEVQRASATRVDTDARYNFGGGLCFGVQDSVDAAMVLSDELLGLGVNPAAWKNSKPGYAFLEAPGIAQAQQTIPARFARTSAEQVKAAIAEYAHFIDPIDPLTAATLGPDYGRYRAETDARLGRRPVQHSFQPAHPGYGVGAPLLQGQIEAVPTIAAPAFTPTQAAPVPAQAAAPAGPAAPMLHVTPADPSDQDTDMDDDATLPADEAAELAAEAAEELINDMTDLADTAEEAMELAAETRAALASPTINHDLEPFTRNPSADIAFPGADDGPKVSREEAVHILTGIVADIGTGNEFKPKDLYEIVQQRTGRSGSWVRTTLLLLIDRGMVEVVDGRGTYVVISTDPADALVGAH